MVVRFGLVVGTARAYSSVGIDNGPALVNKPHMDEINVPHRPPAHPPELIALQSSIKQSSSNARKVFALVVISYLTSP